MDMYYYQGSSEIHQAYADADGLLHTLHHIYPNYTSTSNYDHNVYTQQKNRLFLNSTSVHPLPTSYYDDPNYRPSSVLGNGKNQQSSLSLITGLNKPLLHIHDQGQSSINSTTVRQSVIMDSKFLKPAQELLDEAANVGKGIKAQQHIIIKAKKESTNIIGIMKAELAAALSIITTPQDIQMNKAKLITILDEVEQRYRQYQHQMQIIVASFEEAVGVGSAKTYTQLALKTISKQFRCLKDAISAQIKALSKCLCEEINLGDKFEGLKRKFVDYDQFQNHNNVWRNQRGLPERAVSVLRAWLFDHFLHPYPKDSDKQMLAKQTGLTRSQVSNWFINARVRVWKPMVEEMYMEEMKSLIDISTDEPEIKKDEFMTSSREKNPKKPRNNILSYSMEMKEANNNNNNIFSLTLARVPPSGTNQQQDFLSKYPARNYFDHDEFRSRLIEENNNTRTRVNVNGLLHAASSHPNNILH